MLNVSELQYATQEQFVNLAHQYVSIPAIIILFISMIIAFFIGASIVANNKSDWTKMWKMFGFMFSIITVVTLLIIFLPQLTQKVVEGLTSIFVGA